MIEITHFKPVNKGYVVGTFSIRVPKWGNFCIRELTYFKKNENRWISFPSRQYEKNGEKKYFSFCAFEEPAINKSFQDKLLKCLDEYISKNNLDQPENKIQSINEEIPF